MHMEVQMQGFIVPARVKNNPFPHLNSFSKLYFWRDKRPEVKTITGVITAKIRGGRRHYLITSFSGPAQWVEAIRVFSLYVPKSVEIIKEDAHNDEPWRP